MHKMFFSPRMLLFGVLAILAGWLLPLPVSAVQDHGAPEGLYTHQGAHIFLTASMGLLIYWRRQRKLVREAGWRHIQCAALFLILWNVDAFAAHLLDEQLALVDMKPVGKWTVRIEVTDAPEALAWFYYAAKLDHLLCVPALLFLYLGLRRLLKDARAPGAGAGSP